MIGASQLSWLFRIDPLRPLYWLFVARCREKGEGLKGDYGEEAGKRNGDGGRIDSLAKAGDSR